MKKLNLPITYVITNADRIRSMSDEELSAFICDKFTDCWGKCPGSKLCVAGGGHANGLLKWLQQPVEDE